MRSLKARVVTATGTRVRNVRVEVKPVIKTFAATPAKPTPPKVNAPKPTPQKLPAPETPLGPARSAAASSGPPPMRPTKPPRVDQRARRRSTNPRPTKTRKT